MPHVGGKCPGSSGAQRTTTRLLVFFALGALAVGLSGVLVPCATASQAKTVIGTYTETLDPNNVTIRQEGDNIIVYFTATVVFVGGFTGTGTSIGTEIIHPTGELTVLAVILCACQVTGEVPDGKGELVLIFTATGLFNGAPEKSIKDGEFAVSGTGDLANLHGHGTFHQSNFGGTYKADIHFDQEG